MNARNSYVVPILMMIIVLTIVASLAFGILTYYGHTPENVIIVIIVFTLLGGYSTVVRGYSKGLHNRISALRESERIVQKYSSRLPVLFLVGYFLTAAIAFGFCYVATGFASWVIVFAIVFIPIVAVPFVLEVRRFIPPKNQTNGSDQSFDSNKLAAIAVSFLLMTIAFVIVVLLLAGLYFVFVRHSAFAGSILLLMGLATLIPLISTAKRVLGSSLGN